MSSSTFGSLKVRVTTLMLVIFITSIVVLSFVISRYLRKDVEDLLGKQQLYAASILVNELHEEIELRRTALTTFAAAIPPGLRQDPAAIQELLANDLVMNRLFNGGAFVTDAHGRAIASIPLSASRVGLDYSERDDIRLAIAEGKSSIGAPAIGKAIKAPILPMAVPIRDSKGKVTGVLVGVNNLTTESFFDTLSEIEHLQHGAATLLVDKSRRLIVTATDKRRVMERLPEPGHLDPAIERFLQGQEGVATLVNPLGNEVLVAVRSVKESDWYLALAIPTSTAFLPIIHMQWVMWSFTLVLILVSGALIWWMLARQLTPIVRTAQLVSRLTEAEPLPEVLAVQGSGEVAMLVDAFNGLLQTMGRQSRDLRVSEQKLLTILESVDAHIYQKDLEGRYLFANRLVRDYFRVSKDEIIGRDDTAFFDDESAREIRSRDQLVLVEGRTMRVEENVHCRADGLEHTFLSTKLPLRDNDGRIYGLCGISTDITDRKAFERELELHRNRLAELVEIRTADLEDATRRLRDSERRYEYTVEATRDGIWDWSLPAREVYTSRHYREMLGYSEEELRGDFISLWKEWLHPDDRERVLEGIPAMLATNDAFEAEFRLRCKDGSYKWILSRGKVVERDPDGSPRRIVGTHLDLTARKHLEIELREAKEAAEAATLAKSVFLANMSHEIRTPLNAILGMAHLVGKEGLSNTQAGRMSKLVGATNHLMEILNAVLDLSKIEAQKMELESKPVSLDRIVANVLALLQDKAQNKGIELKHSVAPIPFALLGDATRIQQALLNYAGNAVKFTERGRVSVHVRLLEESSDNCLVQFEVHDTGPGIPANVVPRLFANFEQADSSTTRRFGGTGLGLAITKRLAELMGGRAGVSSSHGEGSTFWFTARLKKGAAADHCASSPSRAENLLRERYAGTRLLLAEDDPINGEIAVELLTWFGFAVDLASDGLQAIKLARSHDYALVLMDVQMPNMNGLEATRELRKHYSMEQLPIIAMTANAFFEDRAACLDVGMNDFVSKPVEPEHLAALLLKWLDSVAVSS